MAMKLMGLLFAAVLLAGPSTGVLAAGQPPAAQDEFVPVDQLPTQEELPAGPLVAAAYGIAWVAVLLYVWSLWRRLNRVERELAEVGRRLSPENRP